MRSSHPTQSPPRQRSKALMPGQATSRADSPALTSSSQRPAVPHNSVPYSSLRPSIPLADLKQPSDYCLKATDEGNIARARAALEGTLDHSPDAAHDLPEYLRNGHSVTIAVDHAKQARPGAPSAVHQSNYQPYRSNQHEATFSTNDSRLWTTVPTHNDHKARPFGERCISDTASISATRSPVTKMSPKRIARKPVNSTRLTAVRPPTPKPSIEPDLNPILIAHAHWTRFPTTDETEMSIPITEHDEPPMHQTWRPESWNTIRDLKECLSGWDGLKRQVLKEHYREPRA
ncbi:hypothetical protein Slin14017_G014090 [Septoria linicola]|nr:hypothetical protein Slin14017_G014090 [Septoria linicola]